MILACNEYGSLTQLAVGNNTATRPPGNPAALQFRDAP